MNCDAFIFSFSTIKQNFFVYFNWLQIWLLDENEVGLNPFNVSQSTTRQLTADHTQPTENKEIKGITKSPNFITAPNKDVE